MYFPFAFVTPLLAADLVATDLMIIWLYMKIAIGVDKRFVTETEAKQIVLEVVEIDGDDINREMALI